MLLALTAFPILCWLDARLARSLEREGLKTTALHGDKSQDERLKALAAFKAGELTGDLPDDDVSWLDTFRTATEAVRTHRLLRLVMVTTAFASGICAAAASTAAPPRLWPIRIAGPLRVSRR